MFSATESSVAAVDTDNAAEKELLTMVTPRALLLSAWAIGFIPVSFEAAEAKPLTGNFLTTRSKGRVQIANWNGVETFAPPAGGIHSPTTVAELQDLVKASSKVRVVGAGHSFNDSLLPEPGGALIQSMGLRRIEDPVWNADGQSATIWVEGGATIAELTARLDKAGLALETVPTSQEITVAGAANGIHGSALRHPGSISDQVVALELVDQHGELRTFSEAEPKALRLARVHLGLLGAVARVQLRVVPQFQLVERDDRVLAEAALEAGALRKSLEEQHDYLLYMSWDPHSDLLTRRWLDIVQPNEIPPDVKRKTQYQATSKLLASTLYGAGAAVRHVPWLGNAVKRGLLAIAARPPGMQVGPSHLMFQTDANEPVNRDTSYGLPLERVRAATRELKAEWDKIGFTPNMPVAIRILPATQRSALALNSGRDTAVVEFLSALAFDDARFTKAREVFEQVMLRHAGRPHWQKESLLGSPEHLYDPADTAAFRALSREVAGDKFRNAWAERVWPAEVSAAPLSRTSVAPSRTRASERRTAMSGPRRDRPRGRTLRPWQETAVTTTRARRVDPPTAHRRAETGSGIPASTPSVGQKASPGLSSGHLCAKAGAPGDGTWAPWARTGVPGDRTVTPGEETRTSSARTNPPSGRPAAPVASTNHPGDKTGDSGAVTATIRRRDWAGHVSSAYSCAQDQPCSGLHSPRRALDCGSPAGKGRLLPEKAHPGAEAARRRSRRRRRSRP